VWNKFLTSCDSAGPLCVYHSDLIVPVGFPPLDEFAPTDSAFSTSIPAELDAPSGILGDRTRPARLAHGAFDRLDLIPSLFGYHIRQIRGRQGPPGGREARKKEGRGGRRGGVGRRPGCGV